MKGKQDFILGMITMLLIVTCASSAIATSGAVSKELYYNGISVRLNGQKLDLSGELEPFIINGTTFLPVRAISQALDLSVNWDGQTNEVILTSNTKPSIIEEPKNADATINTPLTVPTGEVPDLLSPPVSISGLAKPEFSFPLHLYSNDDKVYLGKLVTNEFDSDSIWNEYGDYGSKYKTNSIWNSYGKYGSDYSTESAFNDYARKPPHIVDDTGAHVGYLTTNSSKSDGYTLAQLKQFLDNNNQ